MFSLSSSEAERLSAIIRRIHMEEMTPSDLSDLLHLRRVLESRLCMFYSNSLGLSCEGAAPLKDSLADESKGAGGLVLDSEKAEGSSPLFHLSSSVE